MRSGVSGRVKPKDCVQTPYLLIYSLTHLLTLLPVRCFLRSRLRRLTSSEATQCRERYGGPVSTLLVIDVKFGSSVSRSKSVGPTSQVWDSRVGVWSSERRMWVDGVTLDQSPAGVTGVSGSHTPPSRVVRSRNRMSGHMGVPVRVSSTNHLWFNSFYLNKPQTRPDLQTPGVGRVF